MVSNETHCYSCGDPLEGEPIVLNDIRFCSKSCAEAWNDGLIYEDERDPMFNTYNDEQQRGGV